MTSTYTYDFETDPLISYIRLLVPDTSFIPGSSPPQMIFSDQEITAFYNIQASQFQSGMYFSGAQGRNLPSSPVSYLRVAALAIDTLAGNAARLAGVMKILDVQLGVDKAAASLRAQAKQYRETDDDAGAFAVIEQCNDTFSFRDRYLKQFQRIVGGGF